MPNPFDLKVEDCFGMSLLIQRQVSFCSEVAANFEVNRKDLHGQCTGSLQFSYVQLSRYAESCSCQQHVAGNISCCFVRCWARNNVENMPIVFEKAKKTCLTGTNWTNVGVKSCLTAYTNYPTLYGAGTHGYAEQWVYSCPLLFFSLFIRLWSRPVDVQRYAYFFEKTDVERRGPAYYQHHCWIFLTLGVTRAGRPLPIQETSGGDSSRNVNLDTGQRSWTRLRF